MGKKMDSKQLKMHCEAAIECVKNFLKDSAESGVARLEKRAMLLAYWIKTYMRYMELEDGFSSESVFRLKRGSIICVEFGYRIGRELGGRHYAVVLDVENSIHRDTVTVVPLGSLKEGTKADKYSVVLGDGIFPQVQKKMDAVTSEAHRMRQEAAEMEQDIEAATVEDKAAKRAVQRQKIAVAESLMDHVQKWTDEIKRMSGGTVAKIDQVITVSKMRISAPLQKGHPLYGVRLSDNDLNKIDEGLKKLYFRQWA